MKSKKGLSIIIVVVIVAILIALAVVGVLFFMKNQSKEPIKDAKQEQITVQPQNDDKKNENTSISTEVVSNQLTKADLSLYNTLQDSNYLTVVLYDPLKDRAKVGTKNDFEKPILMTYDLGTGLKDSLLKNGFSPVAEKLDKPSLKYFFGLLANDYVIYQVTNSTDLLYGAARFGDKDIQQDDMYFYKNNYQFTTGIRNKSNAVSDDYIIYGSNFYAYSAKTYKDGRKSTDFIYMNIGRSNDGTKDITVGIRLNKSVPYGNSFVNTVENAIKAGDYKDTITIVNHVDDLNSKYKVYGKEIDLTSTIFYQDAVAYLIAEKYGLNVRNKDFFNKVDTTYMQYSAYGEDKYLTKVQFYRPTTNVSYNSISNRLADSSFTYTDSSNNEFSYFADNAKGYLYVFKNKEYVSTIEVYHGLAASTDVFNHINYLFGIKN